MSASLLLQIVLLFFCVAPFHLRVGAGVAGAADRVRYAAPDPVDLAGGELCLAAGDGGCSGDALAALFLSPNTTHQNVACELNSVYLARCEHAFATELCPLDGLERSLVLNSVCAFEALTALLADGQPFSQVGRAIAAVAGRLFAHAPAAAFYEW